MIFNIGVYIGGEVTKKAILDKLDSYEESIDKNNIYNQFFAICKNNSDGGMCGGFMIDILKTVNGCKHCIDKSGYYTNCVKCPYASEDDCTKQLRDDVIDALKEYRLKLIAESCVGDYMTNYLKEKGATEEELKFFQDLREKYFVHHKSETNKEQPELPGIDIR